MSCQARIIYYLYLLIVVKNVTKEKYHQANYIQYKYNIEDTAGARMFNIQMMGRVEG